MTEDEAKTKWCPMTRAGDINLGATENRPDGSFNCLASGCMMWRWTTYYKNSKTGEAPMKPGAYETGTAAQNGYCGLGGHPFPAVVLPSGGFE